MRTLHAPFRIARRAAIAPWALAVAAALLAASLAAAQAQDQAPQRVTDDAGRTVELRLPVRRIVSLAPSATETLFAIGLGDRIVGDTDYCDFPAAAKSLPHVGGPVDPSLEAIAALHPDLVVVSDSINRLVTVNSLDWLHIPVYATDPHSVEQVVASAERLAKLLDAGDDGARAIAALRARMAQLRSLTASRPPKSAFFVVWQTPLISVGQNTFLADALRWGGVRSILDTHQDWPQVSLEEVVKLQPDYLIFSSDTPETMKSEIADLRARPGWRDLDALRSGRVIILSESINHPSPRLFDAIEQLARALAPAPAAASATPASRPISSNLKRTAA